MNYIRRGNIITLLDDGKVIETKTYLSVNKAKKESHRIQLKEDGALGRGSVMALKA